MVRRCEEDVPVGSRGTREAFWSQPGRSLCAAWAANQRQRPYGSHLVLVRDPRIMGSSYAEASFEYLNALSDDHQQSL